MIKINIPHDHPIIICLFKEALNVIEDVIEEYVAQHFNVAGEKDTMLEELEAAAYAAIYAAWDAAAAPHADGNAMLGCSKTIFIRASANNTRVEIQQSKECFLQQVQQVEHEPTSGIYMPVMITLNKIRKILLCADGWENILKSHEHLGMDTRFPLSNILDSNDLNDVLRCFIEIPEYIEIPKRFAIWCARQVQHLVIDEHSVNALDVAERYLDGDATLEELKAAVDDFAARHPANLYYSVDFAADFAAHFAAKAVCGDDTDPDVIYDVIYAARSAAYAITHAYKDNTTAKIQQTNKLREMLDEV